MRRTCRAVALGLALVAGSAGAEHQHHREAEVRKFMLGFARDWGSNNPQVLSAYHDTHGDLINPFGRRAKGRMEIEKLVQDEHSTVFKGSRMEMVVESVRMPDNDIAFVDADVTITGAKGPDGSELAPQQFHLVSLLKRKHDEWRVLSSRPYAFILKK